MNKDARAHTYSHMKTMKMSEKNKLTRMTPENSEKLVHLGGTPGIWEEHQTNYITKRRKKDRTITEAPEASEFIYAHLTVIVMVTLKSFRDYNFVR